MSTTQKTFGELSLTFTDRFEKRWTDKGSGGRQHGIFYHPKPPDSYHALGTMGVELDDSDDYKKSVNGKYACLVVKDVGDDQTALRKPTDYDRIWRDKGSGAKLDGSCWRPIPPAGYVALGDVFVRGYDKPSRSDIRCVRQDLATRGDIKAPIWKDHGAGSDDNFGSWEIEVPEDFNSSDEKGVFAPNTFIARKSHNSPNELASVNWVLCLEVPSLHLADPPSPPQLTELRRPDPETTVTEDRAVLVPFTAIEDEDQSLAWKVAHSPFYQLRRETLYTLRGYQYNDTSIERNDVTISWTTGVSTTKTEEFNQSVGIEVTATAGVSILGSGGEVSTTVSTQMGWSSSKSVSEFSEQTVEESLTAAPWTAVAMWSMSHKIRVYREDGTRLNSSMEFAANLDYIFDELTIPQE
ncbi:MAG: Vps62-related protein [Nannocystaceae bacterium]